MMRSVSPVALATWSRSASRAWRSDGDWKMIPASDSSGSFTSPKRSESMESVSLSASITSAATSPPSASITSGPWRTSAGLPQRTNSAAGNVRLRWPERSVTCHWASTPANSAAKAGPSTGTASAVAARANCPADNSRAAIKPPAPSPSRRLCFSITALAQMACSGSSVSPPYPCYRWKIGKQLLGVWRTSKAMLVAKSSEIGSVQEPSWC